MFSVMNLDEDDVALEIFLSSAIKFAMLFCCKLK